VRPIFLKLEGLFMNKKPTYNELEQGIKELTKETIDSKLIEKASKDSSEKMKLFAYSVVHDLKSPPSYRSL